MAVANIAAFGTNGFRDFGFWVGADIRRVCSIHDVRCLGCFVRLQRLHVLGVKLGI